MKLTTAKILDIWDNIANCTMTHLDEQGNTVTLISNDALKNFLIKFADWSFLHTDAKTALASFLEYWGFFSSQNNENMWRAYLALNEEYNPLHNYDKDSKITTETDAHTDTQKNPKVKTTNSGGTTTSTDKTSPYDAGNTFLNKEQTETVMPQVWTETDPFNVETDYGKQKVVVTEKTAGNIGVTTSAQMLTGELEVRVNNLVDYILSQFVKQYLFLYDEM